MEPLTFSQVSQEYNAFKQANPNSGLDLPAFAKMRDFAEGGPRRSSAYQNTFLKRINAEIDAGFAPAAEAAAPVGAAIDEGLRGFGGYQGNVAEESFRGLPRATTELAAWLVPGTGIPKAALLAGKGLGMADAALQTFAQTDSPIAAGISAASLPLTVAGGRLGGELAEKVFAGKAVQAASEAAKTAGLTPAGQATVQEALVNAVRSPQSLIADFIGGEVGAGLVQEAARQGQNVATGQGLSKPFSVDNVVSNVAGMVPFWPVEAKRILSGAPTEHTIRGVQHAADVFNARVAEADQKVQQGTSQLFQPPSGQVEVSQGTAEVLGQEAKKQSVTQAEDFVGKPRTVPETESVVSSLEPGLDYSLVRMRDPLMQKVAQLINEGQKQPRVGEPEAFMSADRIADPETFAKFVTDVNNAWETMYAQQVAPVTEQPSGTKSKFAEEFRKENPDIAKADRPTEFTQINQDLMNPIARKMLEDEGLLGPITYDKVSEDFKAQLNRALSGTNQEAYTALVQKYVNLRNIAAREANRQKGLQVQKAAAVGDKRSAQVAQVQELIAKLPTDLQARANTLSSQWLQTLKTEGGQELRTKGRAAQERFSNWTRQLTEAVNNYDPTTGLTTITLRRRVPAKDAEGKVVKTEQGFLKTKGQRTSVRLPLADALEITPKATKEIGKTKKAEQSMASLDALTEEGAVAAGRELDRTWTDDTTEGLGIETSEIGSGTTRSQVERTTETPDLEVTQGLEDVAPSVNSDVRRMRDAVAQIVNPANADMVYNRYIGIMPTTAKGRPTVDKATFVERFPLALRAEMGDADARMKLASLKTYKPVEQLTRADLDNATQGIFGTGAEKINRLRKMWELMRGDPTVNPDDVQFMRGMFDPETGQLVMRGDPKALNEGLKEALTTHFELLGMGPEQVQHFTNLSLRGVNALRGLQDLRFAAIDIKDPTQLNGIANQISERLAAYGMFGTKYTDAAGVVHNNPWIGLVLNHQAGNKTTQPFWNFLTASLGAHETMHAMLANMPQMEQSADPGLRMSAQVLKNTMAQMSVLTPEDRHGILTNLLDTVVPSQISRDKNGAIRPEINALMTYAASKPEETLSTYAQMYLVGLVGDGQKLNTKDVITALRFEAPQMQDFIRGVFRDVSDFTEGLTKLASDESFRQLAGLPRLAGEASARVKGIETLHSALRDIVKPDMQTERAKFMLTQTARALDVNAFDYLHNPPRLDATVPKGTKAAITPAEALLFGIDPKSQTRELDGWTRWLGQYHQAALKTNSPIAIEAFSTLNGVQTARTTAMQRIYAPLMTTNRLGLPDVDQSKPLRQLRKADEPTRAAFNDIVRELQTKMLDEKFNKKVVWDHNGGLQNGGSQARQLNPEFDAWVGQKIQKLSPENKTLVLASLDNYFALTRNAGLERIKSAQLDIQNRLARMMQVAKVPGNYDQLFERSGQVLAAVRDQNPQAFTEALRDVEPEVAASFLNPATTLNNLVNERKKLIDAQPFYASEERPGKWLVEFDLGGERKYVGAEDASHAAKLTEKFRKEGATNFKSYAKEDRYGTFANDLPEMQASRFAEIEKQKFDELLKGIEKQFGPEVAKELAADFNPGQAALESVTATGLRAAMKERRLAGGREFLDYLETLDTTVFGTAVGVANKAARGRMDLLLNDPAMKQLPDFRAHTEQQMKHVFDPGDEQLTRWKTMASAYYMATNVPAMVVDSSQNFQVGIWDLVKDGATTKFGVEALVKGLKGVASWYTNPKEALERAKNFEAGYRSKDNAAAWAFQKYVTEHPHSNPYDTFTSGDLDAANTSRLVHGEKQDIPMSRMLMNGLYQVATKGLKFYSSVSDFNSKAMFRAAFEHATVNKKMAPEAAYDYATTMTTMASYGGARANQSGLVAAAAGKGPIKTIVGMGMVLQQYGISAMTSIYHDGLSAIDRDGRLTPLQRKQARKAFTGRLATQMALGGALGLPFMALALKALQEATGQNLEQEIREGIAGLAGDDTELGAMISDLAMKGLTRQVLGVDLSRKYALNTIMGIGTPDGGFRVQDLLGPLPGVLENAGKATLAATHGDVGGVAESLVPPSLKNAVRSIDTYAKYGQVQFMDKSNNLLYVPGKMETLSYALGFQPNRLAQMQEAGQQIRVSGQLASEVNNREADRAARGLIEGDKAGLVTYVNTMREADPSLNPQTLVTGVIDRAIDMMTPKDFMALRSPLGKKAQNRIIASTFPGPFSRQSEVQRLHMRDQALANLGYPYGLRPADGKAYQRAAMIDAIVQQRGISKPEAAREVEMLTSQAAARQIAMPTL